MESLREMELLKTIVKQSESKPPGYYVTITGRKSEIITSFSPPLSFPNDRDFEMACCSVETFYSFPNIDKTNNSMRISLDGGKKWLVIEIPTGSYEIRAINSAVKKLIEKAVKVATPSKKNSLCISPNRNTLKCEMTLDKNVQVDFRGSDGTLRSVLGFAKKLYKGPETFESEQIVNILRINSIFVHCDIINQALRNGISSPVIYNFFPNVSPGYKIVSIPTNLIYLPLSLNVISELKVWLTDQNDNLIDLRGEKLTITFHIRAC